ALALSATQRQVATLVGPSVAGIIIAASGPTLCYGVDASSWLARLAALIAMRPVEQTTAGRRAMSLQALREGVAFVWAHPVILCMMALDFGQNIFGSARALLPVYARDILMVGPQGLGLLYSATSVGALSMGAVLSVRSQVGHAGRAVLIAVAL